MTIVKIIVALALTAYLTASDFFVLWHGLHNEGKSAEEQALFDELCSSALRHIVAVAALIVICGA